jgi:hypothetical protein
VYELRARGGVPGESGIEPGSIGFCRLRSVEGQPAEAFSREVPRLAGRGKFSGGDVPLTPQTAGCHKPRDTLRNRRLAAGHSGEGSSAISGLIDYTHPPKHQKLASFGCDFELPSL